MFGVIFGILACGIALIAKCEVGLANIININTETVLSSSDYICENVAVGDLPKYKELSPALLNRRQDHAVPHLSPHHARLTNLLIGAEVGNIGIVLKIKGARSGDDQRIPNFMPNLESGRFSEILDVNPYYWRPIVINVGEFNVEDVDVSPQLPLGGLVGASYEAVGGPPEQPSGDSQDNCKERYNRFGVFVDKLPQAGGKALRDYDEVGRTLLKAIAGLVLIALAYAGLKRW